jgi:hypothetical protein
MNVLYSAALRLAFVYSVVKKPSAAVPSLEHLRRQPTLHRDPMRDLSWHS